MKSPQSKYITFEKFLQMHAFTGTSIHSNCHHGVAKYVFYQLKSVTLSCDLNIYELFPGRCCITRKLFILVSVGPIFSVMIEYKMDAHSVVWRIIGRKRLSLSCLSCTFVFPSHRLCVTVSVLYLKAFLYILFPCYSSTYLLQMFFHSCLHNCHRLSEWPWFTLSLAQCMLGNATAQDEPQQDEKLYKMDGWGEDCVMHVAFSLQVITCDV